MSCSVNFQVQVGPETRNRFTFLLRLRKTHDFSEALVKWGLSLSPGTDAADVPELTAFFDQTFEKIGGGRSGVTFGAITKVDVRVHSKVMCVGPVECAWVQHSPFWVGPYLFPVRIDLDIDAILKGFANGRNIKAAIS